jgi:adenine-specific DNA methylase
MEDTAAVRKSRGAFFTPEAVAQFITNWAVRSPADMVLEPAAGDAVFLAAAATRLRDLRSDGKVESRLVGIEIHLNSAEAARQKVAAVHGTAEVIVQDFFAIEPAADYSVVVGNPPYIRYQDFSGPMRTRSRAAALRAGVALTALASSWASFTVHAALFLRRGGRMGLVLPAELLSVNYAAPEAYGHAGASSTQSEEIGKRPYPAVQHRASRAELG